jgi:type III secretion system FlhB-like substrate exporter
MKDLKKAVALKYDKKVNDAPTVLAKGRGLIADQILSIAKKTVYPSIRTGIWLRHWRRLTLTSKSPRSCTVQ